MEVDNLARQSLNQLQESICVLILFGGGIRCKDSEDVWWDTENSRHVVEPVKANSSFSILQKAKVVFRKAGFLSQFLLSDSKIRPDLLNGGSEFFFIYLHKNTPYKQRQGEHSISSITKHSTPNVKDLFDQTKYRI